MPCFATYRLTLTVLATCALTAVIPHVGTISRACEPSSLSTASSADARTSSAEPVCEYGTQPYYFMPADPETPWNVTPKAWDLRAFDARCQPRPLVDRLLDSRHGTTNASMLSIILYGDSVDRTLVDNFCNLARGKLKSDPEPVTSKRYRSVTWCTTDKALVMHSWTNGLHPSRSKRSVQAPEQALNQSRAMFYQLTGKTSPDIILAASCMWDMAFWTSNETFFSKVAHGPAQPHLGADRLYSYIADLTGYVNLLRASFPDVPLVALHTMPQRNPRALLAEENLDGKAHGDEALRLPAGNSKQLLWNSHIAAVNAALRHVAAREALTLLDFERIMMQLPAAHVHARDGFHPQGRLLSTVVLNILLNEFHVRNPSVNVAAV